MRAPQADSSSSFAGPAARPAAHLLYFKKVNAEALGRKFLIKYL